MKVDRFSDFHALANRSGVLFYYQGSFGANVVDTLGQQLQHRLTAEGVSGPARRKVFSTFVEMAHNVMHYGRGEPPSEPPGGQVGCIAMGVQRGAEEHPDPKTDHWVLCANLVSRDEMSRLSARLEEIRAMTHDEVRASYKVQLLDDDHADGDPSSRGAGLGLLTIARDSKQPIEYSFASVAEPGSGMAMFFMRAVI